MTLAQPAFKLASPQSQALSLPYDFAVVDSDGERMKFGFDGEGSALPAEMLPRELPFGGITFHLAPADKGNAVVARGQNIAVPAGVKRLYVLAASASDDQDVEFRYRK